MTIPAPEKNLRILIVDDNRDIHGDFRKILGGHSPAQKAQAAAEAMLFGEPDDAPEPIRFELDSAYQGQEALEQVERARAEGRPYAMAFMDVRMPPGWDGIETTAHIWKIDPDIQIVLCTAYSDYSWAGIGRKLGPSDQLLILKKPFDNVEALQLAAALTEKWNLLQQTRRQLGELEGTVAQRTAELAESERRYRLITENGGDLIEIVGGNGRSIYRSPSFERLFGTPGLDGTGNGLVDRLHPDDREAVETTMSDCHRLGTQKICDFRARRLDGVWLTLEAHCGPFRDESGDVEGVLIVSRDVTERRKLELQLRQAQKLESIGQLATGIAHEINTPTQFIGDNAHFLRGAFADVIGLLAQYDGLCRHAKAGAISPLEIAAIDAACETTNPDYLAVEIPKAVDDILVGVARTAKIVKAMRNFAHSGTTHKTSVDLREIVEDALTITRSEWRYFADAVTEFDDALPLVPMFPGEFSQVLLNLVINATHTIADRVGDGHDGKGTITISARADDDWVEVRVRDDGMGISESVQERVYDPFFTTKAMGKGSGQGLALARSIIVDQHGGSLSFETKVGEGTVFIVRLPVWKDSEVPPAPVSAA